MGRFLTADTHEGLVIDPATLNRYAYAGANPENVIDPSGRDLIDDVSVTARNILQSATQFIALHGKTLAFLGCTAAVTDWAWEYLQQSVPDFGNPFGPPMPPFIPAGIGDIRGILIAGGALDLALGFCSLSLGGL